MQNNALSNHQRTCSEMLQRFDDTLTKAQALYRPNKRRRLTTPANTPQHSIYNQAIDVPNALSQVQQINHGYVPIGNHPIQIGESSHVVEVRYIFMSYFQHSYLI
jgi:uncharacterized damage-inducible protein DinB